MPSTEDLAGALTAGIVAAVGLVRLTVNVLMNAPDGSGSTVTVTLCWVWLAANIRGVVGTAT